VTEQTLSFDESLDFWQRPRFLPQELVAREKKYLQAVA